MGSTRCLTCIRMLCPQNSATKASQTGRLTQVFYHVLFSVFIISCSLHIASAYYSTASLMRRHFINEDYTGINHEL